MKLFLKKIIQFILTLILVYIISLTTIVISNKENLIYNIKNVTGGYGNSLQRFKEAKTYGNIDLLFIGSSHCYRGFDSRVFEKNNIKTFNLGSSSQSAINSYYLIQDNFNYLKPKKVIIEVFWGTYQGNGQESFIDLISNSNTSKNQLLMLKEIPTLLSLNSYLYENLNKILNPLLTANQKEYSTDRYLSGGFVETSITTNKNFNEPLNLKASQLESNNFKNQIQYLKMLISYFKENNCSPILVLAPVSSELKKAYTNYDEYIDKINVISNENNIPFLNFTEDLSTYNTKNDFYDSNHLTQSGVEKFNEALILELNHQNIFEN